MILTLPLELRKTRIDFFCQVIVYLSTNHIITQMVERVRTAQTVLEVLRLNLSTEAKAQFISM